MLAFAAREHRKLAAGEFSGALPDHPDQVIPTAWIIAAQGRWEPDGWKAFEQTAMGFDPAGGGRDAAVLAFRHGGWYGKLVSEQGASTAEATTGTAAILMHRRNNCPVIVDHGGGFAGAVRTRLSDNGIPVVAFNGANASTARAVGTNLPFANQRAEAWWRFREALDPDQEGGSVVALPPDPELRADLEAKRDQIDARFDVRRATAVQLPPSSTATSWRRTARRWRMRSRRGSRPSLIPRQRAEPWSMASIARLQATQGWERWRGS